MSDWRIELTDGHTIRLDTLRRVVAECPSPGLLSLLAEAEALVQRECRRRVLGGLALMSPNDASSIIEAMMAPRAYGDPETALGEIIEGTRRERRSAQLAEIARRIAEAEHAGDSATIERLRGEAEGLLHPEPANG